MNDSYLNESNANATFDMTRVGLTQMVVYLTSQFILLAIEIYILASFSYFIKLRRSASKNIQSGKIGITRKRKILIGLLMSVTITGIIRALIFLQFLFLPNFSPQSAFSCSLNLNFFYIFYTAGLAFLYMFLWYRQHTLYALPILKKYVPPYMNRFSNSLFYLIAISALGSTVGLILSNPTERITYVPQTQTCLFPDTTENNVYLVNVVAYVLAVVYQASLLFCFIFILRHHQKNHMKNFKSEPNHVDQKSSASLQKLIKNCTIAASVCMVTDITTLAISFNMPNSAQFYNLLLFDLDYIINLCSVIFCFTAWKKVINPWPCSLGSKLKRVISRKKKIFKPDNQTPSHSATDMKALKIKVIETPQVSISRDESPRCSHKPIKLSPKNQIVCEMTKAGR